MYYINILFDIIIIMFLSPPSTPQYPQGKFIVSDTGYHSCYHYYCHFFLYFRYHFQDSCLISIVMPWMTRWPIMIIIIPHKATIFLWMWFVVSVDTPQLDGVILVLSIDICYDYNIDFLVIVLKYVIVMFTIIFIVIPPPPQSSSSSYVLNYISLGPYLSYSSSPIPCCISLPILKKISSYPLYSTVSMNLQ